MPNPIIMPKFGQMTEESAIVEWRKKEGEKVTKGDILFTVETDKSVMEVESFFEGTLLRIVVPPGVSVPVSSTVGFVGAPGEAVPAVEIPKAAPKKEEVKVGVPPLSSGRPQPGAEPAPAVHRTAATPEPRSAPAATIFRISPRAVALAREAVIDATKITGSGPEGRVVEKDVKAYLDAKGYNRLRIAPAAKTLAVKEGIDLLAVAPSAGSRIAVADVVRAVAEKPKPMSRMRQVIAQRLTQSFTTTPHFYVTVAVDMTDLIAYRTTLKEQGAPYTVTDFIAEAVVLALRELPTVNSTTDGKAVRWKSHVNLGIAVSRDGGLVVPVVKAAEELTLLELCQQSKQLVDKARGGKLTPEEMSGGTFTISNMGMLNVDSFHAIINPGESAILAVSSTVKQPVVRDDRVVVRQMMKITLSCDHRIVDGALGAQFVNAVKTKLEDLELWKRLTA